MHISDSQTLIASEFSRETIKNADLLEHEKSLPPTKPRNLGLIHLEEQVI